MTKLPENWALVEITEVLQPNNNGKPFQQGWSPQCEAVPASEGKWGVLRTTAIQHGEFWDHENKLLPDHLEPRPQIEIRPGDVLMTCAGPRSRCGVACLVERTRSKLMMSGKMYRFRPHPEALEPKYLAYFIQTSATQITIDRMKTGINDSGLNLTHDRFATLKIPVAPVNEQRRIVAKVEELFSELDAGLQSLKTARQQLRVYKHAVLKHAFEGKLTELSRTRHATSVEPASDLVVRTKKERDARYQMRLLQWNSHAGQGVGKPRPPSYAQPFSTEDESNLVPLPPNWCWAKLGDLFGVYVGATPSRNVPRYWEGDIPWVSSGEVRFSRIASTRESISREGLENTSTEVHPPGTVMLAMIGEGKTRGQASILDIDACHNQNTAAIRVSESDCVPEYLYYYLFYQYQITRTLGSGNNQKALNKDRVSNMSFPLAPVAEQRELVRILDSRISVIDQMAKDLESEIQKGNNLRQSILTEVFSGRLVAQDTNDEPVSLLLARVKAQMTVQEGRPKKNSRRQAA